MQEAAFICHNKFVSNINKFFSLLKRFFPNLLIHRVLFSVLTISTFIRPFTISLIKVPESF